VVIFTLAGFYTTHLTRHYFIAVFPLVFRTGTPVQKLSFQLNTPESEKNTIKYPKASLKLTKLKVNNPSSARQQLGLFT